jgi:hypothetical protein
MARLSRVTRRRWARTGHPFEFRTALGHHGATVCTASTTSSGPCCSRRIPDNDCAALVAPGRVVCTAGVWGSSGHVYLIR